MTRLTRCDRCSAGDGMRLERSNSGAHERHLVVDKVLRPLEQLGLQVACKERAKPRLGRGDRLVARGAELGDGGLLLHLQNGEEANTVRS